MVLRAPWRLEVQTPGGRLVLDLAATNEAEAEAEVPRRLEPHLSAMTHRHRSATTWRLRGARAAVASTMGGTSSLPPTPPTETV